MIKFEDTLVEGMQGAIKGMRFPLQSFDKSDSELVCTSGEHCEDCNAKCCASEFSVGENDRDLSLRLVKAGPEHAKHTRAICVSTTITAPAFFIAQLATYKVGTTMISTSVMHTGTKRDYQMDDFSTDTRDFICDKELQHHMAMALESVNYFRKRADETGDDAYFRGMRMLLPSGHNYSVWWHASYATLRNIYFQRRHHRLQEWKDFCKWVEGLPESEMITAADPDMWIEIDKNNPASYPEREQDVLFLLHEAICDVERLVCAPVRRYITTGFYIGDDRFYCRLSSGGDYVTAKTFDEILETLTFDAKYIERVTHWRPLPKPPEV